MRLMCDEMLAGIARFLRAAGHDTALAQGGARDAALLERCRAEERIFITRDRDLPAAAASVHVVLLEEDELDAQACRLREGLDLDWMAAPFTRCMIDNTELRAAAAAERKLMPETARTLPGPFRACPSCHRLYWPGSHARRITQKLQRWRDCDAATLKT